MLFLLSLVYHDNFGLKLHGYSIPFIHSQRFAIPGQLDSGGIV